MPVSLVSLHPQKPTQENRFDYLYNEYLPRNDAHGQVNGHQFIELLLDRLDDPNRLSVISRFIEWITRKGIMISISN